MTDDRHFYFRGTSEGFAGNPSLQQMRLTPASTDPAVATIFATEAENFGRGVVHMVRAIDLADVPVRRGNFFADLEAEVGIEILPLEFARRAAITISAAEARAILALLGIPIRSTIRGTPRVHAALEDLSRLTPTQIDAFVMEAESRGSRS